LKVAGRVVGVLAVFRLLPHKGCLDAIDIDLFDVLACACRQRAAVHASVCRLRRHGSERRREPCRQRRRRRRSSLRRAVSPTLPPTGTLQQAYLHAGHMVISREPCRVTTVLGSCVAVGLWDPTSGSGA
jgi:hypothetical protein